MKAASLVVACLLLAPVFSVAAQGPALAPAPAAAQDDPVARQLLTDAASAVTKLGGVSFRMTYGMINAPMQMSGDIACTMIRNAANPEMSWLRAKGQFNMPMVKDPTIHCAALEGNRVQWLDEKAKVLFDRPQAGVAGAAENEGSKQLGYIRRSILMPAMVSATPFSEELKVGMAGADVAQFPMKFLAEETIEGEPCKVVLVTFKAGSAERKVWIGRDNLPRRYEQWRSGLARFWQMSEVKVLAGVSSKDVAIAVPDGFRLDRVESPVVPSNPMKSESASMGGPQIGQLAPDFELTSNDGKKIASSSLKGQVVVLTFGGSMFPQSWGSYKSIASSAVGAGASNGGAMVTPLAVACREKDAEGAKKAFESVGGGVLLLDGDATAALYNVRGFPSTVVLGPDWKVAGFFEGSPTGEEVAAAVAKALGK